MSEQLFAVGKVGCYLESITHSTEKRKDGETKVLQLTLRVEPFDAKLATAVAPEVRTTLFKLSTSDAQAHLRKVHFALGTVRQRMEIFATPDTPKGSILIDHVRIGDLYARTSKDARGYALVFKAIFGPPGARELEYSESWRNTMAFVTFTQAEHDDLLDLDGAGEEDDEEEPAHETPLLPEPEFETETDGRPIEVGSKDAARQRLHSHASGKKKQAKAERGAAARKGRR